MKSELIGIAGGSGSGKTELAKAIADILGQDKCLRMECDWYYKHRPDLTPQQREEVNYDHPDSIDFGRLISDLQLLVCGTSVYAPRYDFATHLRKHETVFTESRPIILLDGILIGAILELRHMFNFFIYVDTPPDIRVCRRLLRDVEERGRDPKKTVDQYLNTVRPMHEAFVEPTKWKADFVVPNGGMNPRVHDLLQAALHSFIARTKTADD